MVNPSNASQRVHQDGFCSQPLTPVITPICACVYQLQARSPRGRPCGGINKCVSCRVCRTPPPYYFWPLAATIALERTFAFFLPRTRRTPPLVVLFCFVNLLYHSRMPVHARCYLRAAYVFCADHGITVGMVKRVSLSPPLFTYNLLAPLFRSVALCDCWVILLSL